jgi:hypothetical protein
MDTLPHWLLYAAGFVTFNLALLPGLFGLVVWFIRRLTHQQRPFRQMFIDYAYTLIPLGLAAWVAFSFGFVLVNGSYALPVLSDPFGWGWNLFGTSGTPWTPLGTSLIPFLQVGVLTAGLLFALNTAYKIARQQVVNHRPAFLATLPVAGFAVMVTLSFLRLYLG